MRGDRPPGERVDDLEGFMDEVRKPAQEILDRYQVSGARAVTILSQAYAVTALSEGNRRSHVRQFLEAVETACRELRARLGPPEEEVDDEPTIH